MALKTDNLINQAGTKSADIGNLIDGAAKAWVNWNMTGTPAIRKAMNVSSITDNGVGDQTINFSTALPDANYSWQLSSQHVTGTASIIMAANVASAPTTTQFRVSAIFSNTASTTGDPTYATAAFFD